MTKKQHFRVYLPSIAGGIILLVVIGFIVHFISSIKEKPEKKARKIQAISLMKPPPPPPPPPKVEKPPEPEVEKIKEVEPEPEPEEIPDVAEAPPGDLGLDADGAAGSDGFGLVGRKGGNGLLGGGGNPYAWYGNIIKNDILDILSDKEELRRKGYTAIVKLWVEADGSVKRFELVRGSNDSEIDDMLARMLAKYKKINEPPPAGMEQPVKLKITSRI